MRFGHATPHEAQFIVAACRPALMQVGVGQRPFGAGRATLTPRWSEEEKTAL